MRIRERRLRRSRYALVTAALLLLLSPLSAQDLSELSLSYIDRAEEAVGVGAREEGERYLETALALSPELGDAKVALGEFRAEEGEVAEALDLIGEAVSAGTFLRTAEDSARVSLAELLVRTRQYRAALETLSSISVPGPRTLYLRGLAALELNDLSRARDIAETGRALYPDETRFVDLSFRIDPTPTIPFERWLEEHRSSDPDYLSLLGRFLRDIEPPEAFVRDAAEYLDLGGGDPAVVARYVGDLDGGIDHFIRLGGARDKYALELAGANLGEGGRDALTEAVENELAGIAAASADNRPVTLSYDGDRDGHREGVFHWERGTIVRWEADANQDGNPELTVTFDPAGVPSEARHAGGARFTFDRYPYLATVELRNDDYLRTLYLREERLTHEALDPSRSWYEERNDLYYRFSRGEEAPDEELLLRYTALEVWESSDEGTRYRQLLEGAPLLEYRDSDGDGTVEEIRLFDRGTMSQAVMDPDGDGVFELYERFGEDGVILQGIDEDGTGRSEIFRPFIRGIVRWDSDEDGRTDFGLVTDQIRRFIEIEGRMRNNLERQLELFGNRTSQ